MSSGDLVAKAAGYVEALCAFEPDRHVGSAGNRAATDLFEKTVRSFGWNVTSVEFDCLEWDDLGSWIEVAGWRIPLKTGPYSLPCDESGRMAVVSTVGELEDGDFEGTVLILRGEIAREQLFPKNFEFYNPDAHKRIYAALEDQKPAAIVAVTSFNPQVAGAVYPFPLIEDGDFDIPNAYLADSEALVLVASGGRDAEITIGSKRVPAKARQLIARRGSAGAKRAVVFAHIDGRKGIPAALDNASGAASLMILAELLAGHDGAPAVEIVPLNGEDYYGANGQVLWMRANRERLGDIVLGMNADDTGHVGAGTSVSLYGCPPPIEAVVRDAIARHRGFAEGPQWPQGDHSLFAFNGVPAVALTAQDFMETFRNITHTPKDRPELVDPEIVVEVARFMADVIARL